MKGVVTVEDKGKTAAEISKAAAKHEVHKIKPGVPIHFSLKMEPTDLQKFGNGVQVTLLASRRTPEKKMPKKGTKTPKKGPKGPK
jgi:hypothetical protein